MKKGFTLSELLLSLGIVGVVAALAAPAIVKMMPDKTKTMYIKSYNTLVQKTEEILGDPELYYTPLGSNCEGFDCNDDYSTNTKISTYGIQQNTLKYPMIFAKSMTVLGNITQEKDENAVEFTSADGVKWRFYGCSNAKTHCNLMIYLDGEEKGTYSADNKKPKQFSFSITRYGTVNALDAMGQAYLKNSLDMHFSKEDQDNAAKIYGK